MGNLQRVGAVLIGDGANSGATTLPGIQPGDLYLISETNQIITTNAAAAALPKFSKVRIAMGIAPGLARLSDPIQGNLTSKFEGQSTVAPVEQVEYIGYDGTNGAGIEASSNTEYRLRTRLLDNNRPHGQRATLSDINYATGTSTTKAELAAAIACLYYKKEYGHTFIGEYVKLERISDGTFTALTNNATVVANSDIVVSTAHGASAGDAIRIGGTAATSPVYIVKEVIDANTIKLDAPYQGASGTVLAANIGTLTTPTIWGFKQTAIAQDSLIYRGANEPLDQYEWVEFKSAFTDADDLKTDQYVAPIFSAQKANPGQGYWKQVADREEWAKGYRGDTSKRRFDDVRINSTVAVGTQYDSVVIIHDAQIYGDLTKSVTEPLVTQIYIPDGADQGLNSGDNFLHVLNGFFSTSVGFTAVTF